MDGIQIIWDLEDDPKGNVQHILEHDVTIEEAEEVLLAPGRRIETSRTSGNPMAFGWTSTGKYLVVLFEEVQEDPRIIYPLTAYPVNPPKRKRR